jgi:hypothetical protein
MPPPLPRTLPPPLPPAVSNNNNNRSADSNNANEELTKKRKFETLEIQERTVDLEKKLAAVQEHFLSNIEKGLQLFSTLSTNRMMIDESGRRMLKHKTMQVLNMISPAIRDEEDEEDAF